MTDDPREKAKGLEQEALARRTAIIDQIRAADPDALEVMEQIKARFGVKAWAVEINGNVIYRGRGIPERQGIVPYLGKLGRGVPMGMTEQQYKKLKEER